ncbi:GNAT family N-acetyltransferase [Tumebacillus sp. ITR2]|uniref:GNAT family N-acetyltransferase n=1 Tax=Tumebacillus amylolyticus TaxID=2801339 RepID=A0ABS1JBY1_9BACL|nr:GNAT family N-acetyltransferase [Tumebacillus amylolyticus]MBL0387781.1 GNAT family N-acetyltransferase [Tumebacillus amylolyticus]
MRPKPRKKTTAKLKAKAKTKTTVKKRSVPSVTFRDRVEADDAFLIQVTRETMKEVFEKSVGVTLTDRMILSQIKDSGTSLIIEQDGKPIGYTSYTVYKPKHMYWGALVLAKSAQDQGIGSRICENMFNHAEFLGCEVIQGHVQVENAVAIKFWKRHGFEIVGGPTSGSYEIEKKLK